MSKNKCGDCQSYSESGCSRMDEPDVLCAVPVTAETLCPIDKFTPVPSPELSLSEPDEIIGLRKFGELVGVSLASVQEAIDSGRITAVQFVKRGRKTERKLIREEALEQWNATRVAANNNRAGELPGDKSARSEEITPGTLKTQYEAELAQLRGQKLRLEIDELEGRLHDAAHIEALWTRQLARFRSRVLSIPTKIAPEIVAKPNIHHSEVAEIIQREVYAALSELATFDFQE